MLRHFLPAASLLVTLTSPLLAWGPAHQQISRCAIGRLPQWQQQLLGSEIDSFCADYSYYPDKFFTPPAKPYVLPDPPNTKAVNHIPGTREQNELVFRHYLSKSLAALREQKLQAGLKYLGCISHFLEDSCSPGHLPYGETRVDPYGPPLQQAGWLIDLLEVSEDTATQWIHLRIDNCEFADEDLRRAVGDYTPKLLGQTVDEMVFRLSENHRQSNLRAIKHLIPMIYALDKKDDATFKSHAIAAAAEAVHNVADVLYTTLCLANHRFDQKAPATVNLSEFTPAASTLFKWQDRNHQGRFIRNASGAWHAHEGEPKGIGRHPLRLRIDGEIKTFKTGFGVGHESEYTFLLPPGVFKTFTVYAGNDAELGAAGKNKFEILLDDKVVAATDVLTGDAPAAKLAVPLESAARLTLRCKSTGPADKTHGVWAEPILSK